jgi:hypothetical protein
MDYDAIVTQALTLLQREQRLSYRVLKLRLQLNDDTLEALTGDLIYAKKLAKTRRGESWAGLGLRGTRACRRRHEAYHPLLTRNGAN